MITDNFERSADNLVHESIKFCSGCGNIIQQMNNQICFFSGILSNFGYTGFKEACQKTLNDLEDIFRLDKRSNLNDNFVVTLFKQEYIAERKRLCK